VGFFSSKDFLKLLIWPEWPPLAKGQLTQRNPANADAL
jgi:hypothetical protein